MQADLAVDATVVGPIKSLLVGEVISRKRVIDLDHDPVVLSICDILGNIHAEGRISLADVAAHLPSVHIDRGIVIDCFELQAKLPTFQ